jgi:hypothetical protein
VGPTAKIRLRASDHMRRLTQLQTLRIRSIFQQIDDLMYTTNKAVIEGIYFDLKHKYFDVINYDIPSSLFKVPNLIPRGPILYFPWTELAESYDQQEDDKPEPDEGHLDGAHEFNVVSGDRVSISRIDFIPVEERLRGCNLERRHIFLAIKRKNEQIVEIDVPIIATPKNEIWEKNSIGNYYRAVSNRIEKYFNIESVAKMTDIQLTDSYSDRALRKLQILLKIHGSDGFEAIDNASETVVLATIPSDEIYDSTNVWFTINDAVALGYLWAKSEDERNWAPFGESSVVQQSDAGRASGVSRTSDAEEWKQVFAELIKDMLDRSDKITKTNIIDSVIKDDKRQWDLTRKKLNLPNAAMPGQDSLSKAYTKIIRQVRQSRQTSLRTGEIASDNN